MMNQYDGFVCHGSTSLHDALEISTSHFVLIKGTGQN